MNHLGFRPMKGKVIKNLTEDDGFRQVKYAQYFSL